MTTLTEEQWARMPWHARQGHLADLTHTWRTLTRNVRDALDTQRTTLTWMGTDDTPERHRDRYAALYPDPEAVKADRRHELAATDHRGRPDRKRKP
mgnify:CR=1 FL=1